jgi:hypothetical protein
MKNPKSPRKNPGLLVYLSLTQAEAQTLHRALELNTKIGELFGAAPHAPSFFLARAIEAELTIQLRTDRTGVLCWLNGTQKEEAFR